MVVVIFVINIGYVENKIINFLVKMDLFDIEKLVNILNDCLSGVLMDELNECIFKEVVMYLR